MNDACVIVYGKDWPQEVHVWNADLNEHLDYVCREPCTIDECTIDGHTMGITRVLLSCGHEVRNPEHLGFCPVCGRRIQAFGMRLGKQGVLDDMKKVIEGMR